MRSERGARRARAGRAAGADARSAAPFARHAPPTASRLQNQIQNDLVALQKRLAQVNAAIQRKEASREEYDKTIVETQAAYMKVRPRPSCARASERSDWEGAGARAARACVGVLAGARTTAPCPPGVSRAAAVRARRRSSRARRRFSTCSRGRARTSRRRSRTRDARRQWTQARCHRRVHARARVAVVVAARKMEAVVCKTTTMGNQAGGPRPDEWQSAGRWARTDGHAYASTTTIERAPALVGRPTNLGTHGSGIQSSSRSTAISSIATSPIRAMSSPLFACCCLLAYWRGCAPRAAPSAPASS